MPLCLAARVPAAPSPLRASFRSSRAAAAGTAIPGPARSLVMARKRRAPTVAAASKSEGEDRKLELVRNFRDLASASNVIQPGRLFRTACPAAASEQDLDLLCTTLGIRELVDLRAEEERKGDDDSLLHMAAQTHTYQRSMDEPIEMEPRIEPPKREGEHEGLRRHNLSLLDRRRFGKGLLKRQPLPFQAKVAFWHFWDAQKEVDCMVAKINEAGLEGLYELIFETSKPEIRHVMIVLTEALEGGEGPRPVLFYCKAGKDRTGLVAALVLAVAGAQSEEIIRDYALSDIHQDLALGGMESSRDGENIKKLDRRTFSSAPATAMRATLAYLQREYGGPVEYLVHIGFGAEWQERLKNVVALDLGSPKRARGKT